MKPNEVKGHSKERQRKEKSPGNLHYYILVIYRRVELKMGRGEKGSWGLAPRFPLTQNRPTT